MKALIVRVNKASLKVKDRVISIDKGIVVFVGLFKKDDDLNLVTMADKITNLRIFENEDGKMWHSVKDKNYSILCVPNFTLCANVYKGRRPSFEDAMPPVEAKEMFEKFIVILRSSGVVIKQGLFGEHMDIDLEMDGPVNIIVNL